MHLYTYVFPYPESPLFFPCSSLPLSPWQPITDFFSAVSIVLSSEKCHILFGIIQYVDFSDWPLSLTHMHLSFLCVFYDLIDHFSCWVLFHFMDIWRASWLLPVFGDYDEVIYTYICIYIHTHMPTYTHMYVCTDVGKDPDAGKDRGQKEKGETEDEMVGWHHQLNGQEFEQALGDGEGQGSLACSRPWGRKESDVT